VVALAAEQGADVFARGLVRERLVDDHPVQLAGGVLVQGAHPGVGDALPADPTVGDPSRISQTQVLATMIDGRIRYGEETYELLRFPRAVAAAAPPSAPPTGGDEVYRGGAQQRLADGSDTEHPDRSDGAADDVVPLAGAQVVAGDPPRSPAFVGFPAPIGPGHQH